MNLKNHPARDLHELSQYRQLTMGALSDGLRAQIWNFVYREIPEEERLRRVLDFGSGLGDHLNALSLVEKHKMIALEENSKVAKELKKKHVLVKVFNGNWTDLHDAISEDYENVHSVTGFNFGPGLWPDELGLFLKEISKLPELEKIALVNDLGPSAFWANKNDISELNYVRVGTYPRPKFNTLSDLMKAIQKYEKSLGGGLGRQGFEFEHFNRNCLGEYPVTKLHLDEQNRRFLKSGGLGVLSRDNPESSQDLNIFFREVGIKETNVRHGGRTIPAKVGQAVELWGTRAWR